MPRKQPSPEVQYKNLDASMKRLPRLLQLKWVSEFLAGWDDSLVMAGVLDALEYIHKREVQREMPPDESSDGLLGDDSSDKPVAPDSAPTSDLVPLSEPPKSASPKPVPPKSESASGPYYMVEGCRMDAKDIIEMAVGYSEVNNHQEAVDILRQNGYQVLSVVSGNGA